MVARRSCTFLMPDGRTCRAGPQRDRPFCFAHDPERAADAADARRLGGLRRRKEGTIAVAYDLPGLDTVAGIRRLLDRRDRRGRPRERHRPPARPHLNRRGGHELLKVGEFEERLTALESVVGHGADQSGDDPLGLP
jgi:hypothetical protein